MKLEEEMIDERGKLKIENVFCLVERTDSIGTNLSRLRREHL